jgi:hypothetical protein
VEQAITPYTAGYDTGGTFMNTEELAFALMELFKKNNCRVGDILMPQWILQFQTNLNPSEQGIFGSAIHHLESIDFIKIEGTPNMEQYRLLQAGYNHLYKQEVN